MTESVPPSSLVYHTIQGFQDPWLGPWLDLYQVAFPPSEQMRLSYVLQTLNEVASDPDSPTTLLCALDGDPTPEFAGMAWYEQLQPGPSTGLWYLAVPESLRGKRVGAAIYQEIVRRARNAGSRALLFEVESPEHSPHPDLARRRIETFYRPLGARIARNVVYYQSVGWQPRVRMSLMVHPLVEDLTDDEALSLLTAVFKHGMEPVDHLVLD